ncbi:paraquat-inducible protein A [Aureispira sp. CCB-E]|uniref:paraquat-inducible protein A n=1 Tax=Aureispira sp. CCB-E TaxID=3051121 RepID=UPI0028686362|nr:paraquat-inducible protein A [Aureispira sp. CCB-E]WMX14135.1 paraquat-inducible protein A [Aureispira sp. CCB-E]
MNKKSIVIITSLLFLVIGFILNSFLIQASSLYKTTKEELADTLSYKNRFLDGEEWVPIENDSISNGFDYKDKTIDVDLFFGSSSVQKKQQSILLENIQQAENDIQRKTYYILGWICCYLLVLLVLQFLYQPPSILLIGLISLSIICLHAGLFTPMLEIAAIERNLNLGDIPVEKEVFGIKIDLTVHKKFEGDIYFYYQSKSIAQLIQLLFQQGNLLVAFSILLFSVVFPLAKTLLMIGFVFRPQIANQKWFKNFVLNLSKWSMADVFVVAIFLGFLAFKNLQVGIGTHSNMAIGLYFFFSYCMLSIFSSMLAKMPTEEILTTK